MLHIMRSVLLPFVAIGAAVVTVPAAAQTHSGPSTSKVLQYPDAKTLRARIASINLRIDMLRRADALGSEEAQELRKESRRLEIQLYGLSRREAQDMALRLGRLENRVRFAADDARWGGHAYNRGLDRTYGDRDPYERFGRYQADRSSHYEHFDRYTGSSVDRWRDPFDRGN